MIELEGWRRTSTIIGYWLWAFVFIVLLATFTRMM